MAPNIEIHSWNVVPPCVSIIPTLAYRFRTKLQPRIHRLNCHSDINWYPVPAHYIKLWQFGCSATRKILCPTGALYGEVVRFVRQCVLLGTGDIQLFFLPFLQKCLCTSELINGLPPMNTKGLGPTAFQCGDFTVAVFCTSGLKSISCSPFGPQLTSHST